MFRSITLQKRLAFFILIPVALLLACMGWLGFVYARDSLLKQWSEATVLKLQRAAHEVDMRLQAPKTLLELLHNSDHLHRMPILRTVVGEQLRSLEGVARVNFTFPDPGNTTGGMNGHPRFHRRNTAPMGGMHRQAAGHMKNARAGRVMITPPRYDPSIADQTVSLIADVKDITGSSIGHIEVVVRFDYLVEAIETTDWWHDHTAYLLDSEGHVLISTDPEAPQRFNTKGNSIEALVLNEMKTNSSGTIFHKQPLTQNHFGGFYHLMETPWTLVILAPGQEVLRPVTHLRWVYLSLATSFMALILLLIRLVAGRAVNAMETVSSAAGKVARGDFQITLPVHSHDEIGALIKSFNAMVVQLEERAKMKSALDLAMQVQQNLLPHQGLRIGNLQISGASVYCDETGGDYYDYFRFGGDTAYRDIGVAVGDVTGHGVAAALLMTTARALLRSRARQTGDLAAMATDVNRLLCEDTDTSGSFMTMFLIRVDPHNGELRWVRAGHEPALLYKPGADGFEVLKGAGLALGVNSHYCYTENQFGCLAAGSVLLLGTDGIWEATNGQGEMFGKNRLARITRAHYMQSAETIVASVFEAIDAFCGKHKPSDDITLVVVKSLSAQNELNNSKKGR